MHVKDEIAREVAFTEDCLPAEARINNQSREALQDAYRNLLEAIGEDPDRQGLLRTPIRAARALEFPTQGYRQNLDEIVNGAIFRTNASYDPPW